MLYKDAQLVQEHMRETMRQIRADPALDAVMAEIGLVDELHGHSMNVAQLAIQLAIDVGMSDAEILDVGLAGFLHDAGKTRTPHGILFKPGRLEPGEMAIMRKHPVDGYEMLLGTQVSPRVLDIVLNHHEKNGGTGYPNGLKTVSPYVSIVTVSDIFSALVEPRSYHKARGLVDALGFVTLFEGLDRDLIQRLCRLIDTQ